MARKKMKGNQAVANCPIVRKSQDELNKHKESQEKLRTLSEAQRTTFAMRHNIHLKEEKRLPLMQPFLASKSKPIEGKTMKRPSNQDDDDDNDKDEDSDDDISDDNDDDGNEDVDAELDSDDVSDTPSEDDEEIDKANVKKSRSELKRAVPQTNRPAAKKVKTEAATSKPTKSNLDKTKKSEDNDRTNSTTLYVSRLKRETTSDELKAFIVSHGFEVIDCRKVGHAAFGFVELSSESELERALRDLNNLQFGDNQITVAKATRGKAEKNSKIGENNKKNSKQSEAKKTKKSKQLKEKKRMKLDKVTLYVKNIMQAATKESLLKHFPGAEKVTIGRKTSGATKGFALIKFETEAEVLEAINKYQGMTVDGRELLLDRAGVFSSRKPNGSANKQDMTKKQPTSHIGKKEPDSDDDDDDDDDDD